MKRLLLVCAVTSLFPVAAAGQAELRPEVSLDRTAFFVGEPILYHVQVRHDSEIEFILDRLDKSTLEMAPFEVLDLQVEQGRLGEQQVLTVMMRLVTFETVQKNWLIPPFNLYYVRQAAGAPAEGRPAERLTVPPVPIGFRSSLPAEAGRIRTGITFASFTWTFWVVVSAGILGLAVLGGRGALAAYRQLRSPGAIIEDRGEIARRAARALDGLLAAHRPEEGAPATLAFFQELAGILRDYAGRLSARTGPALTAREVGDVLTLAGEDAVRARRIADLLALSDRIRYTDDGPRLGRERLGDVRAELGQLFR